MLFIIIELFDKTETKGVFEVDVAKLEGIVVPMVTPLNDDETVDYPSLRKLVNYIIDGGVQALFPMGTTGEFARLTWRDRCRIIEMTVRETQKRVPVIAGISDSGLHQVLENLKVAEAAGADAVAVTPPYYYPTYSDDEIIAFYREVAAHSSLPLILYNIPVTCGSMISIAAIQQILFRCENVIGIKDSSGDISYLAEILNLYRNRPEVRIFVGDEALGLEGLSEGAHGLVASLANVFPRIFVALYEAVKAGELQKAASVNAQIREMNQLNRFSRSWMSAITWRKAALAQMGICREQVTRPYIPVDDSVKQTIAKLVALYQQSYVA
jgi:dihydrodipicolinate synthase/N-acetylneuraminate lyase